MIQLDCVSKVYPAAQGEVRAVDELSLEIRRGQFVAIRGPSGCGKSTLLMLIGGMTQPTLGRITVAGQTLTEMTAPQRNAFRAQSIGFVFQMFHLLPYLNVLDNVLLADGSSSGNRSRAAELLASFGLERRLTHRPGELSVGERQRVALARAVLNRPPLLLADEPTGNLDAPSADAVLGHLRDYHREGGTILLVTHDDRAAAVAETSLTMSAGRL